MGPERVYVTNGDRMEALTRLPAQFIAEDPKGAATAARFVAQFFAELVALEREVDAKNADRR